ncbi:MAG: SGNH/GDSL hydrolase family protein [Actinobacteria bacterium]|nr:SGNH/GDSL hydrolase family protein [Actinomycetota bacterium]
MPGPLAKAATAIGASVVAVGGLLTAQAFEARRRIGPRTTTAPYADGRYGSGTGTSIRLAVLGDSGAAGLGAERPDDTMGAILATALAEVSGRTVTLSNHAVIGAQTSDLDPQIDRAMWTRPHVAVIMVGANDVTHLVPRALSARRLRRAIRRLREEGIEVVMATCPDLGTVKPVPQPLRAVMRRSSRRLAAAQAEATLAEGGRPVSLGARLGPEFDERPDVMFAEDRFHPSTDGYTAAAQALLPEVIAAWRLGGEGEILPALADDISG